MKNKDLKMALRKMNESSLVVPSNEVEIINPAHAMSLRGGSAPSCPKLKTCTDYGSCTERCGIKAEL